LAGNLTHGADAGARRSGLRRRSALALGAAAWLAACEQRLMTPTRAPPLHIPRLADGFAALASRALPGAFALGVMCLDTTELWCSDRAMRSPLGAAVALPVAAAALAQVDAGALALNQPIGFDADELSPPPSVIDARWPAPADKYAASVALSGLIELALAGDNTAIDALMKTTDGPGGVEAFLEAKNLPGLRVDRYRREALSDLFGLPPFRPAWKDAAAFDAARAAVAPAERLAALRAYARDPRDSATVPGALGLLASLSDQELLTPASTARLLRWMTGAPAGGFRAGLPAGVKLAQVSALASGDGVTTAAAAELAIGTWPNGTRYALVGFLTLGTLGDDARRALFADAAALAARAIG
jgi:beta-lactamase class A